MVQKLNFSIQVSQKNYQRVQKGATFPFFKTMNLKVLSKLVLNFLMIKSALHVFCSLLIKYG